MPVGWAPFLAGDLCRGPAQARGQVVGRDLDLGALVALLGITRALVEPPGHDHPGALGQRGGGVLSQTTPGDDVEERGRLLAFLALAVGPGAVYGDAEGGCGLPIGGEADPRRPGSTLLGMVTVLSVISQCSLLVLCCSGGTRPVSPEEGEKDRARGRPRKETRSGVVAAAWTGGVSARAAREVPSSWRATLGTECAVGHPGGHSTGRAGEGSTAYRPWKSCQGRGTISA